MDCRLCKVRFSSIKIFKVHFPISHPSEPFTCCCGRNYNCWRGFDKHVKQCDSLFCIESDDGSSNANLGSHANTDIEVNINDIDVNNIEFERSDGGTSSDFPSILKEKTEEFVSNLYVKRKLPRQYVQDFITDVNKYISDVLLVNLKDELLSSVKLNDDQTSVLNSVFNNFQDPFSLFSSECKRFTYFQNTGDFIPPFSYEVGEVDVSVPTVDGPILKPKKVFGQAVPLDLVLKKFLELPNCLSDILSYMDKLSDQSNETKENFIQCNLWKAKRSKFSPDDIVIPLHYYYDDVECNNPLGSRPLKLGAVYVMIPCLPPECQSALENIFVALVFETWVRNFGDEVVFKPLINMLTDLEKNGILVNGKRVYFVTGLLLGDNLGMNSVCGYVESFSAHYYCRFCRTIKSIADTQSVEDVSLLRSKESYQADVLLDDPSLTGVKKDSALNELPSFHVTSNLSVDVFHDLCEGTCHYVMLQVLNHCIPKYFTLQQLNNRIDLFQYGPCDSNRIPIISDNFAERDKLKMSGSETWMFVKMFGILVGDLVPSSDDYWKLYLKLVELLDICFDKNCSYKSSSLRVIVREFCEMYVSVTGDTLKPKMHLLLHYGTVYDSSGPLSLMSTKRCESKHRDLLIPAHATESRRNICKTVLIHHQLNMCHRFRTKRPVVPEIDFGPIDIVTLPELDSYFKFAPSLPQYIKSEKSVVSPNWVNIKGTDYKPGMVVIIKVSESGAPVFGVIEFIILFNKDVTFVFSYLLTIGFEEHVHSYQVEFCDKWSSVNQSELYDPLPINIRHGVLGFKYIVLRHSL